MTKEEGGEEEVVCETGTTRKELMWDGMANFNSSINESTTWKSKTKYAV